MDPVITGIVGIFAMLFFYENNKRLYLTSNCIE